MTNTRTHRQRRRRTVARARWRPARRRTEWSLWPRLAIKRIRGSICFQQAGRQQARTWQKPADGSRDGNRRFGVLQANNTRTANTTRWMPQRTQGNSLPQAQSNKAGQFTFLRAALVETPRKHISMVSATAMINPACSPVTNAMPARGNRKLNRERERCKPKDERTDEQAVDRAVHRHADNQSPRQVALHGAQHRNKHKRPGRPKPQRSTAYTPSVAARVRPFKVKGVSEESKPLS